MTPKVRYKLRKFIDELESYRGRHTELVSVYVPAGYDLNKIINHLFQEQGTAANIKDKTTRNNVIAALEKMISHLRLYKRTPPNGLAIFSGNVAEREGKTDSRVWAIEPPEPINVRIYRCDQTFLLDPLKEMIETKDIYGLIVLDKREANVGLLKGTAIVELSKLTSGVPGKVKAGGFSQARYARLREEAAHEFFKRVGEIANKEFKDKPEIKGILLGGPGPSKEEFLDGNYLDAEVKKKIIAVKDISYTGDYGLHELVEKSKDVLAQTEIVEEKKILQRFFNMLAKEPNKVAYGINEVKNALQYGAAELVIVCETLDDKTIEELEKLAENVGAEFKIVSVETHEGKQLENLGKVGALLRYAIS